VAYTDDDCFADPDWLYFLVSKLLETGASGVGGPNLLPTTDGPVARSARAHRWETAASGVGGPNLLPTTAGPVASCVSASPGTPAHILLDDNVAEHVPGCNMAFWGDRLRAIGA